MSHVFLPINARLCPHWAWGHVGQGHFWKPHRAMYKWRHWLAPLLAEHEGGGGSAWLIGDRQWAVCQVFSSARCVTMTTGFWGL